MKWTNTRYAALGLLALASMGAMAQTDKGMDAARARAVATFKENGGQWDARAKFLSQSPGLDYWVTGDGFVVDQYKYVDSGKPYDAPSPFKDYDKLAGQDRLRRKGNVVFVSFVNGTGRTSTQAYGPTKGSTDYFLPGRTVRNVHSYQEAVVKSVYPGIHTRHYRLNGDVRYDLIVDPGANPNLIENVLCRYEGHVFRRQEADVADVGRRSEHRGPEGLPACRELRPPRRCGVL